MMAKQEICPECEAVYEITEHKIAMRDKDSYRCDCGHEFHWNGAIIRSFKQITPGKAEDA